MRRVGYLPHSTPDVADLVRAVEVHMLGAVIANSHHVLCPLFSLPFSGDLASAETT